MLLSCFYGDRDPALELSSWVLDFSTSIQYIHGIMHGEAWNEANLEEVTLV